MKISLSTSSVNPMNVHVAFEAAQLLGYDGIELMVSPNKITQDLDYMKKLVDTTGVPITSVHAPTLLLCKFVWGTSPEGKLVKSVDFANRVGATSVVVHPPFKSNHYSDHFIDVANKLNRDSGVDVAIENMFPWVIKGKEVQMYGPSWEETCERADNLTFDFSHAALSGMDVMEFFNKYHHKVRVIHFTDGSKRNKAKGDAIKDEHMLPGEGDMPLREVYSLLKEKNWTGDTVLEINTRKNRTVVDKLPALQKSIDYFHEIAD
jgi:sugar phosphate isomerase/epimerase